MAKKHISRIVIAGLGIGIILAVIIPVIIFIIPINNITSLFGIETIAVSDQEQFDKFNGIINPAELPVPCFSLTDCEDKLGDDITVEIKNATIYDDLVMNETEIKIIPIVIVQPPPPEPPAVQIISSVTKIDNTKERFESKTNVGIPLLSFFVEDTTNKDFDNGFIEHTLKLISEPNKTFMGKASYDILIRNQSIFQSKIGLSLDGTTDEKGELTLQFISPLGQKSDLYTFDFKSNIDKFIPTGTSDLDIVLSDVSLKLDDFSYGSNSTKIFSMQIARDSNQLIIQNEQGQRIRIFPSDDRLSIYPQAGSWSYATCTLHGGGYNPPCYQWSTVYVTIPAPTMGTFLLTQIKDGQNILLDSGHTSISNFLLQRTGTYKIVFSTPTAGTVTFTTPITQKDFNFSCQSVKSGGNLGATVYCNYLDQNFLNVLNGLK